nr:hypothetical protein [uncultured Nitrososphaera sp.]
MALTQQAKAKRLGLAAGLAAAGASAIAGFFYLRKSQTPPVNKDYNDGVVRLNPTADGGREWNSFYMFNRQAYALTDGGGQRDKVDNALLFTGVGSATIMGDGTIKLEGDFPRLHISDPRVTQHTPYPRTDVQMWKNIEFTCYFFVQNQNEPVGTDLGVALEARLGDFGPLAPDGCLSYQYSQTGEPLGYSYNTYCRYNQGKVGVQKEVMDHGAYTNSPPLGYAFGGSNVPFGQWFGMKLVLRNMNADSAVKIETYVDKDDTQNWQKVGEFDDAGGWAARPGGVNAAACPARPLDMIINWATPDIRIRADYAAPVYIKNLSCREIDPLP